MPYCSLLPYKQLTIYLIVSRWSKINDGLSLTSENTPTPLSHTAFLAKT